MLFVCHAFIMLWTTKVALRHFVEKAFVSIKKLLKHIKEKKKILRKKQNKKKLIKFYMFYFETFHIFFNPSSVIK